MVGVVIWVWGDYTVMSFASIMCWQLISWKTSTWHQISCSSRNFINGISFLRAWVLGLEYSITIMGCRWTELSCQSNSWVCWHVWRSCPRVVVGVAVVEAGCCWRPVTLPSRRPLTLPAACPREECMTVWRSHCSRLVFEESFTSGSFSLLCIATYFVLCEWNLSPSHVLNIISLTLD